MMRFRRILLSGPAIVVVFDMCSSSNIIEELSQSGEIRRFKQFLKKLKRYLAKEQEIVLFDPYKFTGDGWILLFPPNTNGIALSDFLHRLCQFSSAELKRLVLPSLKYPPSLTGLTFGIDMGPVHHMTMYQQPEYIGRAINIACRLQNAVKDKGGAPANKALVSDEVFTKYFDKATLHKVFRVTRQLRNINRGQDYRCRKIELFRREGAL